MIASTGIATTALQAAVLLRRGVLGLLAGYLVGMIALGLFHENLQSTTLVESGRDAGLVTPVPAAEMIPAGPPIVIIAP